jgi:Domain of unknown function (DUF4399)
MKRKIFATALGLTLAAGFALAQTPSLPGARVYFINVANGAHVKSPVLVQFGLSGMGIAPAGSTNPGTGHHHLIVDADTPPAGQPIPMDDKHLHYGRGQTEMAVPLPPGNHTLQLVLADGGHVPHNPAVTSDKITITVDP